MKKSLLILMGLILLTALPAIAQPPVQPYLPFYWLTGTVNPGAAPDGAANREVVFYKGLYGGNVVSAVTDAGGNYRLNIYELSYFYNEDISDLQNLKAAVAQGVDGWGANEVDLTIDLNQGYLVQNLDLIAVGPQLGAGSITGIIVDSDGNTVADTDVTIWIDGDVYNVTTDAQGRFTIDNVPVGDYIITAGYTSPTLGVAETGSIYDVVVTDGNTTDVGNLNGVGGSTGAGSPSGTIRGTLLDQNGDPIANRTDVTVTVNGQTFNNVITDSQGRFAVDGVDPGTGLTVQFSVDALGLSGTVTGVDVIAGQATDVGDVTLITLVGDEGSMAGTVTDASSGDPIQNVTVSVGGRITSTLADGTYLIADLSAGTYIATARATGYLTSQEGDVIIVAISTTEVNFSLVTREVGPGPQLNIVVLLEGYYDAINRTTRIFTVDVEARSGNSPDTATTVVGRCSATFEALDGIVRNNGWWEMVPPDSDPGDDSTHYYLAIRHQLPGQPPGPNHLGIITKNKYSLTLADPFTLNLAVGDNAYVLSGNFLPALKDINGVKVLWLGDINGDSNITAADSGLWLNIYLEFRDQFHVLGDYNQDGYVTAADAGIWLNNYLEARPKDNPNGYIP